jgi:hypothetical protein
MADADLERRLRQAAAGNPELAGMFLGKHDDPSRRYRRLGLLVLGAAAAIGVAWLAASALAPPRGRPPEPAEAIDDAHYLSPMKTAASGPGEETAPFTGFAISVETEPPGALVSIAGVPRGEAPVLANLDCKPGARLEVRAEKAGLRPARRETTCRADALLKLTIRLAE